MSDIKADEKVQTVMVDGRSIPFYRGESVIQAATRQKIEIPHYCWHPRLSIAANCRMCLVEVEKAPKLVPACQTECKEGMVVHTHNDKVQTAQRQVHEFLLVNHPIDCPICDQAGECKLQDYYMRYQLTPSRMKETKSHKPKSRVLGPHIVYNAQRCIMCTRCVRFMEEVPKSRQLGVMGRGDHSTIGTTDNQPLDNPYSLNTVDVCPVGALTSTAFRFKQRVWNLRRSPSICPGCAKGCNINVDQRSNQVYRLQPRENEQVNQSWLCDAGRLTYDRANKGRFTEALVRDGDFFRGVTASEGVAEAAGALSHTPLGEGLVVALSLHTTCEQAQALVNWLVKVMPKAQVATFGYADGVADELLRMADQNPNRQGVMRVLETAGIKVQTLMAASDAVAKQQAHCVLVIGHEGEGLEALAQGAPSGGIVQISFARSALSNTAVVQLPALSWVEETGTWLSGEGRLQQLSPAFAPGGDAQPLCHWLAALAEALKAGPIQAAHPSLVAQLTAPQGAFAGLPLGALGPLGIAVADQNLAASA